uniref:Pecanex-like protein n=1 Tax=Heterorhabditis bacteriophora TaxID=37862 RepID=A0A1I7XH54_HETBA
MTIILRPKDCEKFWNFGTTACTLFAFVSPFVSTYRLLTNESQYILLPALGTIALSTGAVSA